MKQKRVRILKGAIQQGKEQDSHLQWNPRVSQEDRQCTENSKREPSVARYQEGDSGRQARGTDAGGQGTAGLRRGDFRK